ncbi:uncharacterized protein LOC114357893 [Ostrinia furnacalis]|uniref:uncharacterized protein LOC114357893 n=1 Tax=Ostrinia furnacalis TaxID=93504 RepID=UPI001038DEBC|nr:uncharacterized protein LOC114357893 [Ostrinia furnacalis]
MTLLRHYARLVLATLASEPHPPLARDQWDHILTGATEICILIEKQACSTSYGGFLLALIELIGLHLIEEEEEPYDLQLVVCLMRCKPPPFLALKLLELAALPARAAWPCPRPSEMMDVDDETNSDVCCLPALLGQAEAALAAAARHRSGARARAALRQLSELLDRPQARSCSCLAALWRAFALALCCCVELLLAAPAAAERQRLESACRGGLARAGAGAWSARPAEGRLAHAAARLRTRYPDWPEQTELLNAFQTAAEEVAAPRISQPNITTFFETN